MAVSPVNLSRISQNLRTDFVIEALRQNQLALFREQSRIASGRRFGTPSEDPVGAARAVDLTQALDRQEQLIRNVRHADSMLAAADSSLTEINSLLIEAQTIASQDVSNLTSEAEREADSALIAGIREQLQLVGNRTFNGRFLFGGRETQDLPFIDVLGGIAFVGDTGDLVTRITDGLSDPINVTGDLLFGAMSRRVSNRTDLSPLLTADTRIADVNGAARRGVELGTLVFNEPDGVGAFSVNLSDADTIGDIINLINRAAQDAGSELTAAVGVTGIDVTPGGSALSISDRSSGAVAQSIGLFTKTPTTDPIVGDDLGPRITRLTPLADLASGTGIDVEGGLIISNGPETVTIDTRSATTVQDIINSINTAGVYTLARINAAGTGIEVFNRVSGSSLSIGENGGTTATDLGIRTLETTTRLPDLNFGLGVTTKTGLDDLRVTAKDGSTFDVNLDGAITIQDVLDKINEAADTGGVGILAALAINGNGIRLTDSTNGTGNLSIGSMNASIAAQELGLLQTVTGETRDLISEDRSAVRAEGILGALTDLERALRKDDTQGISLAAGRVDKFIQEVTRIHGTVGARSQAMRKKLDQMADAGLASEILLSQVRDLDYAEAITKMQSAITQLQASLQTSSVTLNLSLMDFLR